MPEFETYPLQNNADIGRRQRCHQIFLEKIPNVLTIQTLSSKNAKVISCFLIIWVISVVV